MCHSKKVAFVQCFKLYICIELIAYSINNCLWPCVQICGRAHGDGGGVHSELGSEN